MKYLPENEQDCAHLRMKSRCFDCVCLLFCPRVKNALPTDEWAKPVKREDDEYWVDVPDDDAEQKRLQERERRRKRRPGDDRRGRSYQETP